MRRLATIAFVLTAFLLFAPASASAGSGLRDVRFWAVQIQGHESSENLQRLVDSRYDLLVIDETRSLKGESAYDMRAAVALLHASPGARAQAKLVLAYMDIGEAEDYRWYWQSNWRVGNPDWIVAPDPDGWEGNYPVLFWRQPWKDILYGSSTSYLDMILADGFDGIYLDWIEAATFEPIVKAGTRENKNPRAEMIALVSQLAAYARARNPDFIVIPQNALDLARPADPLTVQYFSSIDAVAQEAVWFDGSSNPNEPQSDLPSPYTEEALEDLAIFQAAGKTLLTLDYALKHDNVAYAYQQAAMRGFLEYVTTRQLDALTSTPPPAYPIPEFEQIALILGSTFAIVVVSCRRLRARSSSSVA